MNQDPRQSLRKEEESRHKVISKLDQRISGEDEDGNKRSTIIDSGVFTADRQSREDEKLKARKQDATRNRISNLRRRIAGENEDEPLTMDGESSRASASKKRSLAPVKESDIVTPEKPVSSDVTTDKSPPTKQDEDAMAVIPNREDKPTALSSSAILDNKKSSKDSTNEDKDKKRSETLSANAIIDTGKTTKDKDRDEDKVNSGELTASKKSKDDKSAIDTALDDNKVKSGDTTPSKKSKDKKSGSDTTPDDDNVNKVGQKTSKGSKKRRSAVDNQDLKKDDGMLRTFPDYSHSYPPTNFDSSDNDSDSSIDNEVCGPGDSDSDISLDKKTHPTGVLKKSTVLRYHPGQDSALGIGPSVSGSELSKVLTNSKPTNESECVNINPKSEQNRKHSSRRKPISRRPGHGDTKKNASLTCTLY